MKASKVSRAEPSPSTRTRSSGVGIEPPAYGVRVLDHRREARPEGGRGVALPPPVQATMERAFAADFSSVQIHAGASPANLGAQAWTRGTDIHFAPGRYQPHSLQGRALIGHELAHVVQQSQGRVPVTSRQRGLALNRDHALEREADVAGARAAQGQSAGLGPLAHHRSEVVQGFGIDARAWNEVTAVRNLSKGAYLVSAGEQSLIIKLSGSGELEIGGSEGPTQETLGAELANLVGVRAARTIQIIAKEKEAEVIIKALSALGGEARQLAGLLARVQSFLVMEFVEGAELRKASRQYLRLSMDQRMDLYTDIGRLYAFDVFIDNTDRFIKTNLGNLILGDAGTLTGIDQMIQGVTDVFAKGEFSAEASVARLEPFLDAKARRKVSLALFASIRDGVEGAFISAEEAIPFATNFELGVLEMIGRIAARNVERDVHDLVRAKHPLVQEAIAQAGLSGLEQNRGVFAKFASEAAEQAEMLSVQWRGRKLLDSAVGAKLVALRHERDGILDFWADEIAKLYRKWKETQGWHWGASAYWRDKARKTEIDALVEYHGKQLVDEYKTAVKSLDSHEPNGPLISEQAAVWLGGIEALRSAIAHVLDKPAEIGSELVALHRRIRHESTRSGAAFTS